MGKLILHPEKITPETGKALRELCPFGAIQYEDGKLSINSACRMCKMCVRKGGGAVEYVEDEEKTAIDKSQWRGICVYADHRGGKLHRVTFELLGKARELAKVTGHPVYALLMGADVGECAKELLHYGADRVFVYEDEALRSFRMEPYVSVFEDFIQKIKPSAVLVGATNLGRQLAPGTAARCRTGLTADCTALEMKENTDLVQIRPAFGGNIMARIVSTNHRPQFCTVRYKIFDEPARSETASGEIVPMTIPEEKLQSGIEILRQTEKPKEIDISEADVIVAVGRGAQSEECLAMARELADLLGGVLACSRPLAEANILDGKHQIGLSGRTVKPKFILTLGISGAVQFAAGMKSSDCIVAVNSDKNAPIFNIAHYAVIGDVNVILPQLISMVKERRENG